MRTSWRDNLASICFKSNRQSGRLSCSDHEMLLPPTPFSTALERKVSKFQPINTFTCSPRLQVHMHLNTTRYVTKSTLLYSPSAVPVLLPAIDQTRTKVSMLEMNPTPRCSRLSSRHHQQLQSPVQPRRQPLLHPTQNMTRPRQSRQPLSPPSRIPHNTNFHVGPSNPAGGGIMRIPQLHSTSNKDR